MSTLEELGMKELDNKRHDAVVLRLEIDESWTKTEYLKGVMASVREAARTWAGDPTPTWFVIPSVFGKNSAFGLGMLRDDEAGRQAVLDAIPEAVSFGHVQRFDPQFRPPLRTPPHRIDPPVCMKPPAGSVKKGPSWTPDMVLPSLRFLLSEDAKSEGKSLKKWIDDVYSPVGTDFQRQKNWLENCVVPAIAEQYPNIHRADELTGGLISDAFKAIASVQGVFYVQHSGFMLTLQGIGNPNDLKKQCRKTIDAAAAMKGRKDSTRWIDEEESGYFKHTVSAGRASTISQ